MKALIIDEPWIGMILRGEKTWEMRKTATHQRGVVGLIRKGSGLVVGTAEIVGSFPPIDTRGAYAAAEPKHGIPPHRQEATFADGWRTPWVLANARSLPTAVAYEHPSGAVIWVNLAANVATQVEALAGNASLGASVQPAGTNERAYTIRPTPATRPAVPRAPATAASDAGDVRIVTLTGGNVRNNHIYLPLDFFPDDAIGGGNKSDVAPRTVAVRFQPGTSIETDIDRTKRILRSRSAVGEFFTRAGIAEGDRLIIRRTGAYSYDIAKDG